MQICTWWVWLQNVNSLRRMYSLMPIPSSHRLQGVKNGQKIYSQRTVKVSSSTFFPYQAESLRSQSQRISSLLWILPSFCLLNETFQCSFSYPIPDTEQSYALSFVHWLWEWDVIPGEEACTRPTDLFWSLSYIHYLDGASYGMRLEGQARQGFVGWINECNLGTMVSHWL